MDMKLIRHIVDGRWFMAFGCLLVMALNGAIYTFSIYSSELKSTLGYDQTTLNLLGFAKDFGTNFGIIAGLIYEITSPWFVQLLGAILNFFGYFMIWLALHAKIPKPTVWQMCVYIGCGANSMAFVNTGALVTCVKNFPESRGVVLGLMKGYIGLSGAILTQIYHAIYGDDSKSLLMVLSWLPAATSIVFLKTIRIMKVIRQPNELKVFYKLLYLASSFAVCLMIIIIWQKFVQFSALEFKFSAACVVILLTSPIIVVIWEEVRMYKARALAAAEAPKLQIVTEATPATAAHNERTTGCFEDVFKHPERGEDYTILQGLCNVDMLIIFIATGCGIGGTITAIDNLGQIGGALEYPKRSISIFVSLVSIWSFFGRVITGFGSEILLKRYRFPRPLALTFTLFFASIGHLLIAFNIPYGLYAASMIIGFCSGAQWPLMYAVISELFGLKYYSTLYNFGTMASPVGSFIFNVLIVGHLYDKEARKQMAEAGLVQKAGEGLDCKGGNCYRWSFVIIASAAAFGAVMWGVLVVRTKEFYSSDIYRKYREDELNGEFEMEEESQPTRRVDEKA